MMILSLFIFGDVQSAFKVFLQFISLVFHEVGRARKTEPQNSITKLISQLLVRPGSQALPVFTAFLEKIFLRGAEIDTVARLDLDPISSFIDDHESDLRPALHQFMDQPCEQHILVYAFAQNFRFLANVRQKNRIPLT
jgi:hypothetical protein